MVRSKLINDHIRPLLGAGTDPDSDPDSEPDESETITESVVGTDV